MRSALSLTSRTPRPAAKRPVRRLRMTRSPKEKSCPRTRPAVEATTGVRQVLVQADLVGRPEDLDVTAVPLGAMAPAATGEPPVVTAPAVALPRARHDQVLHDPVRRELVLPVRATPVGDRAGRGGIGPPETSTAVRTVGAHGWRPRSRGYRSPVSPKA